MKLWLTRDKGGDGEAFLWCADSAPELSPFDTWEGAGKEWSVSQTYADCEPGTCTRLYTEQEMRRMVAEATVNTAMGHPAQFAHEYIIDPTDANWQRLAEAVWPGGGSTP